MTERNFYADGKTGFEYPTPDDIFDAADAEFGPFTLDPATNLSYHTSRVILARGGHIITLAGSYERHAHGCDARCNVDSCIAPDCVGEYETWDPQETDGLAVPWSGRVWLNHPYGRDDWKWIKKARDSVRYGDAEIVVALVPVKTQMRWWQRYVAKTIVINDLNLDEFDGWRNAVVGADRDGAADIVRFLPGRLRFGDSTTGPEPYSAPFSSAIVVWRKS